VAATVVPPAGYVTLSNALIYREKAQI